MNLSLETAKEMYKSDIPSIKQFALDNYHEEELKQLDFPKSWEDLKRVKGEFIDSDSNIHGVRFHSTDDDNKDIIPEGLGQSVLDLIQLLQVRDRYREIEGFNGVNLRHNFDSITPSMFGFTNVETFHTFIENFKEQLESVSKLYK